MILENLLLIKAYPLFNEISVKFLSDSINHKRFQLLKLMYHFELNDIKSVENYFLEKEKDILKGFSLYTSLKKELDIIKRIKLDDSRIEQIKFRWSGYFNLSVGKNFLTNELFEYLLYAKELVDFTLIYACCENHTLREMIGIYIQDNYDLKEIKRHKFFRSLDLVKGKTVKVEFIKSEDFDESESRTTEIEEDDEGTNLEFDNKVTAIEQYVLGNEEIHMIESIKKNQDLLIKNIDMVVSFISFNFYTAAEIILDHLEEEPNYYYLKAEIKYRSGEFYETLYFANKALFDYELIDIDKAPFEYIKGLAYEQLGKPKEARMCFDKAVLLDATFKSAKDKIV